jgi:hypothetical protein
VIEEPDRRPLWPDVLLLAASAGIATAGVYGVVSLLSPHPRVAVAVLLVIAAIAPVGAIVALGAMQETLRCRKHRNWVRFVGTERLRYQERGPDGSVSEVVFSCARADLGPWHTFGWDVEMPSESEWDGRVPEWAHGRRAQIRENIVNSFGGGTVFQFRSAAE